MIYQQGTIAPKVAEVVKEETIVRTIKLKTPGREEIIHVGAKIDVDENDTLRVDLGDNNVSV